MRAVIMAGGKGTRLRPFTTLIPKPLVPIGGNSAVIEIIIQQLVRDGFDHITVCLNHQANLIRSYLGNGEKWGICIDYSTELQPLGTMGPLTLIPDLPESFLIMNGDVLCDIDYAAFLQFHTSNDNQVTVSTFKRGFQVEFGVLETGALGRIVGFKEKPQVEYQVSMGVYCMRRSEVEEIPRDSPYGFDHLMLDGIQMKKKIVAKLHEGFWVDIGRPDEYDYCNENFEELKLRLRISG